MYLCRLCVYVLVLRLVNYLLLFATLERTARITSPLRQELISMSVLLLFMRWVCKIETCDRFSTNPIESVYSLYLFTINCTDPDQNITVAYSMRKDTIHTGQGLSFCEYLHPCPTDMRGIPGGMSPRFFFLLSTPTSKLS